MNTRTNNTNALMVKVLGALAVGLFALASPQRTQAQLPPPPPITLNYSFNVPVVKVVPNPCTTGLILVSGNMGVNVATTQTSTGFSFTLGLNSNGKGEDAMADGTLLLDGTQKSKYLYSSTISGDAQFQRKPADFSLEMPITDALFREFGDNSDAVVLQTNLQLNFLNGIPSAPVIKGFNVRCTK